MNLTDILLFGDAINGGGGESYSGAKALVLTNRKTAEKIDFGDGAMYYRMGDGITVDEFNNAIFGYNGDDGSAVVPVSFYSLDIDDASEYFGFPVFMASTTFEGETTTLFNVFGQDVYEEGTLVAKAGTYVNEVFTNSAFPTILVYGI